MRIAIVNERVGPWRGGAETSTLEMAAALVDLGGEVTLITSSREVCPTGIELLECGSPSGPRSAAARLFVRSAEEAVGDGRFDIVHAVTPIRNADVYQPRGGTYIETIKRSVAMGRTVVGRGVKRISRWLNARQRFLLATERGLLTRPSPPYVAAVSEYVKRQVQQAYGTPPERVRVVFNGVAIEPLANDGAKAERAELRGRFGCSDESRVALFVAHNFKLKGLAELIRATAGDRCARPRWTCWVAGRDNANPYRRLAASLGVEREVMFLGADVPVRSLYAAADVLAHPTFYDPCSRVVLESLCCGLPVVTTRHNGAAEVMRAGIHGEVVDSPRQIDALRRAIGSCLSPAVADACRSDAAAMCSRLSMSRHAAELIELYERVLSNKLGEVS